MHTFSKIPQENWLNKLSPRNYVLDGGKISPRGVTLLGETTGYTCRYPSMPADNVSLFNVIRKEQHVAMLPFAVINVAACFFGYRLPCVNDKLLTADTSRRVE